MAGQKRLELHCLGQIVFISKEERVEQNGVPGMGNSIQASHIKMLDQEVDSGWAECCRSRKFKVPAVFCRYISATNSGRDPASV